MLNSQFLAAYSSDTLNSFEDAELRQRLELYQLFLKLYEHRRELLDEILALENSGSKTSTGVVPQYVQGVVLKEEVYLVTNLLQDKTQVLKQLQPIWTIGRDRQMSLPLQDRRLSRHHAAIQYVENQRFDLVDFDSTNGSFVNGERAKHRFSLKDGDQIRLGSLSFTFFVCCADKTCSKSAPELHPDIPTPQETFQRKHTDNRSAKHAATQTKAAPPENGDAAALQSTLHFLRRPTFVSEELPDLDRSVIIDELSTHL